MLDCLQSALFITEVKSYVSRTDLKLVKTPSFYHSLLEEALMEERTFTDITIFKRILFIRSFLLKNIDLPVDKILTLPELLKLLEITEKMRVCEGFTSPESLNSLKIWSLYRSLFLKGSIFEEPCKKNLQEVEYFQSLIFLILILEYELHIKYYKGKKLSSGCKHLLRDIEHDKRSLYKKLKIEIRKNLSMNRVSFLSRVYTSFDTEYQLESSEMNELLAYTSCSYNQFFLSIKPLDLKPLKELKLASCDMLLSLIHLLRRLVEKRDDEVDKVLEVLSKDSRIRHITTRNTHLFTLNQSDEEKRVGIAERYYDLNPLKKSDYSMKNLIVNSILEKSQLEQSENFYRAFLGESFKGRKILTKKELVLIAHFTTADLPSLSDFSEYRTKFTVLRKTFVTMDKALRYNGWKVLLRDTSLLSPGGASLSSIGELYSEEFKKVEISPVFKSNMKKYKKLKPAEFKRYAVQDSLITL